MHMRKQRGMTSFIVIGSMFVLLILGLSLVAMATHSLKRSETEKHATMAFHAAQAALEYQMAEAYAEMKANDGEFIEADNDLADVVDSIAEEASAEGLVQPTSDTSKAWVTATVSYKGKTRSLRAFLTARDVSIWNNAIFAGTGADGQSINGNVDIRGSVHILGDGEAYSDLNGNGQWDDAETFTDSNSNGVWDPGEPYIDTNSDGVWNSQEPYNDTNASGAYDPPLTVTDLSSDLSGTAHIGNNYYGMPTALAALIPAPATVNGLKTLNAEVRAKHGQIGLSGNATIGSTTNPDDAHKGQVDGTYVNDGYTGNKGSSQVYSDNGATNQYDLAGMDFKFPLVTGIGAEEYIDDDGNSWDEQKSYLDSESLVCPVTTITATTAAFSYSDANGNSISFTPQVKSGGKVTTPAKLVVNGVVKFNSNLVLGASKETIRYEGSGTLYTPENIDVHCSLLPSTTKVFPLTARLGLIAQKNMNLATGSGDAQLEMAGAFYAQGTITSAKQNQILGTFVANFFDMGTNVPNIYQVPTLRHNLPPAMPGADNLYALKQRTWRDRKVSE